MSTIADHLTNDEIMRLLGERFKNRRLGRNTAIETLADRSGVNRKTIIAMEAGEDVRLSSVVKVLRGLDMIAALDAAFPDVLPGGEGISTRGQPRMKASTGRRKHGSTTTR